MNNMQKAVMLLALALVLLSGLFPPWQYHVKNLNSSRSAGYHLIFSPPKPSRESGRLFGVSPEKTTSTAVFDVRLDTDRFGVQLAVIGFASVCLFLLCQGRNKA
jgi:hypothetical protein